MNKAAIRSGVGDALRQLRERNVNAGEVMMGADQGRRGSLIANLSRPGVKNLLRPSPTAPSARTTSSRFIGRAPGSR